MHIPQYWAQARLRHETGRRHGATVQRWGWSDTSQQHAEDHARERAEQALRQLQQPPGQRNLAPGFKRQEWLGEYGLNGATPIREEVLQRRGDAVLTRNSYGAHCLNTEQVAIADLDFALPQPGGRFPWLAAIVLLAIASALIFLHGFGNAVLNVIAAVVAVLCLRSLARWSNRRASTQSQPPLPGNTQQAMELVQRLHGAHPDWGLRVYETPKGLRVMLTHCTLAPQASEVQTLFAELRADPVYRLLCEQQQCFRARVSGKPWRMGLASLPTAERRWPLPPHREAARRQWTAHYDHQARRFAACRLLQQLGSPRMPPEIQAFVQWHDEASQAESSLPLA